jgi:4'-phosphopantetheinyl transferase
MSTTTVDVWLVDAATEPPDEASLDDVERARLATIQHPTDRRRFVAAHTAVRRIAAARLGVPPAGIRWILGPNGKPSLAGDPLRVNLSHSGDLVLVAVTASRAVGVDLQQVLPGLDVVAMAARFYPPGEAGLVQRGGHTVFAELWARKEAVVKAAGDRLTRCLTLPVAGDQPREVRHDGVTYRLADLAAPEGFRAAVALAGHEPFAVRHHPKAVTQR